MGHARRFLQKGLTLLDTKPVLLINNHKTQLMIGNSSLNKRMSTNNNINVTLLKLFEERSTSFSLNATGKYRDAYAEWLQKGGDSLRVLRG